MKNIYKKCDLCSHLREADSASQVLCASCSAAILRLMSLTKWHENYARDCAAQVRQMQLLQEFVGSGYPTASERAA